MNVECCWKKRIKIVILPLAHLQGNSLFVLRCVECFRYLQLLWTHLFASRIHNPRDKSRGYKYFAATDLQILKSEFGIHHPRFGIQKHKNEC